MVILYYSTDAQMAYSMGKKHAHKLEPKRNEFNFVSLNMAVTSLNTLYEECEMIPLCFESKTILADGCYFFAKTKTVAGGDFDAVTDAKKGMIIK